MFTLLLGGRGELQLVTSLPSPYRVTLETEAYQVPQGRMEKLALLGSWDHQGLLDPLGLQARDVQQNLDLRYFCPFCD